MVDMIPLGASVERSCDARGGASLMADTATRDSEGVTPAGGNEIPERFEEVGAKPPAPPLGWIGKDGGRLG